MKKPYNTIGYNEVEINGIKILIHEKVKYKEYGIRIKISRDGKFDVTGIDYYKGY